MKAAPAISVRVRVPPGALWAVGLLGLLAGVVTAMWAMTGADLRLIVPLGCLALTLHLLIELHGAPLRRLRWDGAAWWLRDDRPAAPEVRGELTVACDLGQRLLLHFVPDGARRLGGGLWLPLQRTEVEGDWHGLRCALYSPRAPLSVPASEALDG